MLQDDDSTGKHLSLVRRHQRRCRAMPGAAPLATAIEPARAALVEREAVAAAALRAEEDARDDLELADAAQDDEIRNLAGRASEHDRNNPGAGVLDSLFRAKNPSEIVGEPLDVEARSIEQLATAVEALGAAHPLAGFAATLRERSRACTEAQSRLTAAITARAIADGDEENAQAALRRAYESNYFDARRQLGKSMAERLFPRLRRRTRAEPGGGGGPAPT
jgi:hypothetical protein